MPQILRSTLLAAALAALSLLGACGGGGGDEAPAMPPADAGAVPDSAITSVAAFTSFTARLITEVDGSQTAAPLRLNAAAAPVSDSASPAAVH